MRATGSGTKLHHLPQPVQGEPLRPMAEHNQIVEYEPADLVVTVQCGIRLCDLQTELARHGQWLPLDPPYPEATVGGVLATNSSGPLRHAFGTARDWLIGLKVEGRDGEITKSGGKVVKNVTGYDVHKLHIGAFGTLGILREASFKLRPMMNIAAEVRRHATFEEAHRDALAFQGLAADALDAQAAALVGWDGPVSVVAWEGSGDASPLELLRQIPERTQDRVRYRLGAKPYDLPAAVRGLPCVHVRARAGIAWVMGGDKPQAGIFSTIESAPQGKANDQPPFDERIRRALWG